MPDFFGEENVDPFGNPATSTVQKPAGAKASTASDQATYLAEQASKNGPGPGYVGPRDVTGGATGKYVASDAYKAGVGPAMNGYGAMAGYYAGNDATRAAYDQMHDLGSSVGYRSGRPLNRDNLISALDSATGGAVSGAMGGAGGGSRGPGGLGSSAIAIDTQAALDRTGGQASAARGLGMDVLRGQQAPGGAGAAQQQDVLDQVLAYAQAPQAGPSKAELLLQDASQGNMADVLSAARSGRARDAGSQARAMNVAQGEIAGLGVDAARNAALLRQQEAQDFRNQQLSALGLGGDVSGAIRGAGIQERGQTLDFTQGQQQIGAGLEGDLLKAIPQLEQIRHEDEFDLTPQQKIEVAKAGQRKDPSTTDQILGIAGDLLPFVGGLL